MVVINNSIMTFDKLVSLLIESKIDVAAHKAATSPKNNLDEPTEDQKKSGNYKKGKVKIGSLNISIENPIGSYRTGIDSNGKKWSVKMKSHYGYITGTLGKDGDHIDIFIEEDTSPNFDGPVFVVNQCDPSTRKFDEHKVVLGDNIKTKSDARKEYLQNYSKGWNGIMNIVKFPNLSEFSKWAKEKKRNGPA